MTRFMIANLALLALVFSTIAWSAPSQLILKNQFGEQSQNWVVGTVVPFPGSANVVLMSGATTPVNGGSGTGAGIAAKGSLYVAQDSGALYQNTNTKASPTWANAGASALTATLTGFSAAPGTVASTDTILQGFNKLASINNYTPSLTTETVSAAGALSTTKAFSLVNNASGSSFAVTLAAPSSQDGQIKVIKLGTATHGATLAMTNIAGPGYVTLLGTTTLTFTNSGDSAVLMAVGAKWVLIGGSAVAS